MADDTTVAVLGTGIMGTAMARNLLAAAETRNLRMQIAESVMARFDEAIQAGHGEEGMAAVYRAAKPDRN